MGFMSDHLGVWFMFILLSPWGSLANIEVDALSEFKSGLKDRHRVLDSWETSNVNPCEWFHITCDSSNSVIRIDLGNTGLSGPLSSSLGNLANLQYLELYENKFNGHIPPELGNLTNLVSLDLYSNSLTGNIPVELGNCFKLKFFRLQYNDLCGRPPIERLCMTFNSHGGFHGVFQIYPGNKYLCNPFKNKYCKTGCCKFCP